MPWRIPLHCYLLQLPPLLHIFNLSSQTRRDFCHFGGLPLLAVWSSASSTPLTSFVFNWFFFFVLVAFFFLSGNGVISLTRQTVTMGIGSYGMENSFFLIASGHCDSVNWILLYGFKLVWISKDFYLYFTSSSLHRCYKSFRSEVVNLQSACTLYMQDGFIFVQCNFLEKILLSGT